MSKNNKPAKVKSVSKGMYAKSAFICNGIAKEKDAEVSKDEIMKMSKGKNGKSLEIGHLLYEVE